VLLSVGVRGTLFPRFCLLVYFIMDFTSICNMNVMSRAHSFRGKNLTKPAANLVNSAVHRGKADEIPRLTAATQLNIYPRLD